MTRVGQQEALPQEAEAHVQQDERADDQAVALDGARRDGLVQPHPVAAWAEPWVAGDEAADEQPRHADQDEGAEQVGDETEEAARRTEAQPSEPRPRQQAVGRVHHVDQQVEREAVEHEGVEERDPRTAGEHRHLAQGAQQRATGPARQVVEPRDREVALAARHDRHDAAEAGVGVRERHGGDRHKQDLLGDTEHAGLPGVDDGIVPVGAGPGRRPRARPRPRRSGARGPAAASGFGELAHIDGAAVGPIFTAPQKGGGLNQAFDSLDPWRYPSRVTTRPLTDPVRIPHFETGDRSAPSLGSGR